MEPSRKHGALQRLAKIKRVVAIRRQATDLPIFFSRGFDVLLFPQRSAQQRKHSDILFLSELLFNLYDSAQFKNSKTKSFGFQLNSMGQKVVITETLTDRSEEIKGSKASHQ